jgi:hypothetical protein
MSHESSLILLRAGRPFAERSILLPRREENSSFLTELRERPRFGLTRAACLTIEPQLSNHARWIARLALPGMAIRWPEKKQE